jgi:anti-sigma regulatory factor (Ser/Thr protein kinase)
MKEIKLLLKNNINELNNLINGLEKVSEKWNIPLKTLLNINLVLEEIITNIVFYAYDDEKEHIIVIKFWKEGSNINIKIVDDGKEFNILKVPEPDTKNISLEEKDIGGLGINFVRKLMDKVEYQRKNKKNILILTKCIKS